MSDILFKCPACSLHLAVDEPLVGTDLVCPVCGEAVHVPQPSIFFACPSCKEGLYAGAGVIGEDFECASCQTLLTVPDQSSICCKRCSSTLTMDDETYQALAGQETECPKCGTAAEIPAIPQAEEQPEERTCPGCSVSVSAEAVICVQCGTDLKTGHRLETVITQAGGGGVAQRLRCHKCGEIRGISADEYKQAQLRRTPFDCPTCGAKIVISKPF